MNGPNTFDFERSLYVGQMSNDQDAKKNSTFIFTDRRLPINMIVMENCIAI